MSFDITVPHLYCPFPSRLNFHADDAMTDRVVAWAKGWGLVPALMSERRFRDIRVVELTGRTLTRAPRAAVELVADWNGWLHFWDDQCDEGDVGKAPALLSGRVARFLEVLRGDGARQEDGPTTRGLMDVRDRLYRGASDDWIGRFYRRVEDYFAACLWEAKNRAASHVPDVSTYIRRRRDSGAVYTEFVLFEHANGIALPAHVREHAAIQRLSTLANNVISWSNDIISFDKEMERGDYHNLVLTLRHEHGLSLQESIDRAGGFTECAVREFMELEPTIPSFGPALDVAVGEYVSFLRDWMRGNIDWSLSSGRFLPGRSIAIAGRPHQGDGAHR